MFSTALGDLMGHDKQRGLHKCFLVFPQSRLVSKSVCVFMQANTQSGKLLLYFSSVNV